ncbi:carboxypeptidase-like regulatory domain-containing protein [Candidatus Neomarinimicrobiota bacterium]
MKNVLLLIIFFSQFAFSQEQVGPRICGNVIDAETREPIAYANIFISNSSIGGASNKYGYFELRNVPYGRYEIIASVIGYEVLKAKIGIYENSRRNFRFEMYKQPIQMEEVIVSGKETWKRRRQLKSFRRNLLGSSKNGKKSYITNEEVLRFTENKHGTLMAFAEEPLKIINNGLGYKIYYVLEDFELTPEYVKYTGYPHFTEKIATTFHDSVDWPENRKNTYTGSLRHFLTIICENYEITEGDTTERLYVKDLGDMIISGARLTYGDTTHIEDEGFSVIQTNYIYGWVRHAERRLVNTNWFLSETENTNEMNLKFGGFLEVKYEDEFYPFKSTIGRNQKVSWINMTCESTILDKQGRYFDIYAIKTTGLWSKERVADMLPFDYTITKE